MTTTVGTSGTINQDENEVASDSMSNDSSRSSIDNENSDGGEEVPDVLYQVKVNTEK